MFLEIFTIKLGMNKYWIQFGLEFASLNFQKFKEVWMSVLILQSKH